MPVSPPSATLAAQLLTEWEHHTRPPQGPAYTDTRALVLHNLAALCQALGPDADGNLDIDDLRTVLHTRPSLRVGRATATGAGRALRLAQAALANAQPRLLGPEPTEPACRVLLIIESYPTAALELDELTALTEHVQQTVGTRSTKIIFGHQLQPKLSAELRLHLLLSYGPPLPSLPAATPRPALRPEEVSPAAVRLITEHQKVSVSFLQRHLKTGYNRTCQLLEELEAAGIIWQREDGGYGVSID